MDVTELLSFAVHHGASDLHLSSGEPPMLRVNGDIKRIEHAALSADEIHNMAFDVMNDGQRKVFQEKHDIDFSFELGEIARFRVNVFLTRRGEAAVFRVIPSKIVTLDELSMPPVLKEICKRERGFVLCTGPTGSGKSTTLAAMVDYINEREDVSIITIEDPIEFVHHSKRALVNQREVGIHTHSFANALRGALREDPDVILVGEMRDLETIALALTAAETGQLVFATLHTSSAPKTVDRVIDAFPSEQQNQVRTQLSESLQAVITQSLCKRKGGGRIAACEILMGVPAAKNLIREAKIHQLPSVMQTGQKQGMQTLDMALQDLLARGLITREEAQAKSPNPQLFGAAAVGTNLLGARTN
ncbi:MAG: type IV pilus twitching motility protein PilT [Candidatus Binatia bacterium]